MASACDRGSDAPPDGGGSVERDDGGAIDARVDGGSDCRGTNDCYECTPTTDEHFLNRCTSATCEPFDNAARLPRYNGGDLPAL